MLLYIQYCMHISVRLCTSSIILVLLAEICHSGDCQWSIIINRQEKNQSPGNFINFKRNVERQLMYMHLYHAQWGKMLRMISFIGKTKVWTSSQKYSKVHECNTWNTVIKEYPIYFYYKIGTGGLQSLCQTEDTNGSVLVPIILKLYRKTYHKVNKTNQLQLLDIRQVVFHGLSIVEEDKWTCKNSHQATDRKVRRTLSQITRCR